MQIKMQKCALHRSTALNDHRSEAHGTLLQSNRQQDPEVCRQCLWNSLQQGARAGAAWEHFANLGGCDKGF